VNWRERRAIGIPKRMIIRVTSKDQIMSLRSSKEIKETGIGMIIKFKILSKITFLLMNKERTKMLILKSIFLATSFPHLTQSTYEESLMDSQLNELSKGENTSNNPNRYSLR